MASLNKCLFIGNLTADPEIRTMPNGEQVANFTIALNERYKAKDGNIVENVEYVRIVLSKMTFQMGFHSRGEL